jgi:single-strand DNA-binding protein
MNYICLVGRLVAKPKMEITESGKECTRITLAVKRSYKNEEGYYDTDFIDIEIYHNSAIATCEYCEKGNLVGVRGRLETKVVEDKEEYKKLVYVAADKISFLAASRKGE